MPDPMIEEDPQAGVFLPWKLALNRPLVLPQSKRKIPFEDYEVGRWSPASRTHRTRSFDSLADWYAEGDVLEVRIPWTMLGYTDPSTLRVWDYPYEVGGIRAVKVEGLRVYPTSQPRPDLDTESGAPRILLGGLGRADLSRAKEEELRGDARGFDTYDQVATPPR